MQPDLEYLFDLVPRWKNALFIFKDRHFLKRLVDTFNQNEKLMEIGNT